MSTNCPRHGQPDSVEVSGNLSANEAATLLPDWRPLTMGIYGVYASRRHPPAAVRALLDFLAEWMAEWAGEKGR